MAYTSIPDTDIDTGSPLDTDLFTAFRDNIRELRQSVFQFQLSEATTTTTGYVTAGSMTINIPSLADDSGWTRKIIGEIEAKNSSTSYITSFRIQDSASGTNGTEVTTSSSTYVSVSSTLTITSSWLGTTRTLNFQYKSSNALGTAYAKSDGRFTNRLHY